MKTPLLGQKETFDNMGTSSGTFHWGLIREWPDGSRQFHGYGDADSLAHALRAAEGRLLTVLQNQLASERESVLEEHSTRTRQGEDISLNAVIGDSTDLMMSLAWSFGHEAALRWHSRHSRPAGGVQAHSPGPASAADCLPDRWELGLHNRTILNWGWVSAVVNLCTAVGLSPKMPTPPPRGPASPRNNVSASLPDAPASNPSVRQCRERRRAYVHAVSVIG